MTRSASLILSVAAVCLISSVNLTAQAQTVPAIPKYFFTEWKITKDCTEQHAGPEGHVQPDQRFRMTQAASSVDGQAFELQSLDAKGRLLGGDWAAVNLEFRAGRKMTTVPADFECIPGDAASSPFLAMSGYSTLGEPWYEYEHWYGTVNIHGQKHHILIFPRDTVGKQSAVILLQDADSGDNIRLDHGGIIHTQN